MFPYFDRLHGKLSLSHCVSGSGSDCQNPKHLYINITGPLTSATTVLTVIGMAVKVGRETYDLLQNTRKVPTHIQQLVIELEGVTAVLAVLQKFLEKFNTRIDPGCSAIMANLETNLADCVNVFVDMKIVLGPFIDYGLQWKAERQNMGQLYLDCFQERRYNYLSEDLKLV